ncbi:MAG: formyltransferase family protein [Candidatus Marinimicrobia bacterium]|nr:formyltransferase family protein [Candidatus Neomarinimicrobiota bacterium]
MKNKNQSIYYAFLVSANHLKPSIVLNDLLIEKFVSIESTIILTDSNNGRIIDFAEKHSISFYVCLSNNDIKKFLYIIQPKYLISCGWHSILPGSIIKIPQKACLNCHGSLLPDYKGASPFKHYWSNWEKKGGASIHLITDKIDEGHVIVKDEFGISLPTSPKKILIKTSKLTAELLKTAIKQLENEHKGEIQKGGRYFFKISNFKHFLYWLYNGIAVIFNFKRKYTPYKQITR